MISTFRGMFAACAIALLCLVSVSLSASLSCEVLAQPLDHHHHLEGGWAVVAASLKNTESLEQFKSRDSCHVIFSNTNETSYMSITRIYRSGDKCEHFHNDVTREGSGFCLHKFNFTITFLYTSCPDCVVLRVDKGVANPVRVYLSSKRRELEMKEMEEFGAQLKCLMMPPPARMDPTKELCQDQPVTQPTAETQEKTEAQEP